MTASYSAQGTKLNRRGAATRRAILDAAVALLATGDPDALSANLVAREAGVTWGTIKHQFGDTDGLFAAVVVHVHASFEPLAVASPRNAGLRRRVADIVDVFWKAQDTEPARAVQNLRRFLPDDPTARAQEWPVTDATLREHDAAWLNTWGELFSGLEATPAKLRGLSVLIPAAVSGLHGHSRMSAHEDSIADGLAALVDAVTCYLG
jgi:AcrR family transcriptional regulator